jgi:hypothetical protein
MIFRALNLCVRHRKECSFYAKPVVRDITNLETAIEDWQVSKQARRGSVKTEEPDWPLPVSTYSLFCSSRTATETPILRYCIVFCAIHQFAKIFLFPHQLCLIVILLRGELNHYQLQLQTAIYSHYLAFQVQVIIIIIRYGITSDEING